MVLRNIFSCGFYYVFKKMYRRFSTLKKNGITRGLKIFPMSKVLVDRLSELGPGPGASAAAYVMVHAYQAAIRSNHSPSDVYPEFYPF